MFKKHYLLIIALMASLLAIGLTVVTTESFRFAIGRDHPKIYEMCRSKLFYVDIRYVDDSFGHGPWKYELTSYYLYPEFIVIVSFDNGAYTELCYVKRHGSEWQVTNILPINVPAPMP